MRLKKLASFCKDELCAIALQTNLRFAGHGKVLNAIRKSGLIFVHIPKCGGKSVIKALYGLELHEGFGHAGAMFYKSMLGPSFYNKAYSFCFVRNPVSRLISGFNFAKNDGFGTETDIILATALGNIAFDEFVMDWLTPINIDRFVIFRPQHKFIEDTEGNIIVSEILNFERISYELDKMAKYQGESPEHLNMTKNIHASNDAVTREITIKIAELYNKDYKLIDKIKHK